jgi:hypothetical protein
MQSNRRRFYGNIVVSLAWGMDAFYGNIAQWRMYCYMDTHYMSFRAVIIVYAFTS